MKRGCIDMLNLLGDTKEFPDKIKDANVFVLSSDFEGMPIAVAEAFAMGVPVVSTDCPSGGARMLVKEEETGLLVPVGNKEKMAEAILRILQDEKLAAHLRETAFAFSQTLHPDKINEMWKNYIEDICKSKAWSKRREKRK